MDEQSRKQWMTITDAAMELAKQTFSVKNTPFPKASNVKFPLITQAVYEYGSRTFAEIVRGNRIAKFEIFGRDLEGAKLKRAQRLQHYNNYVLLNEQKNFRDGLDRTVHSLPMVGTTIRKVHYDPIKDECSIELCYYKDICINHMATSLEEAPRITHRIFKPKSYIIGNMRFGLYRDINIDTLDNRPSTTQLDNTVDNTYFNDDDAPYTLIEQHRELDLDGDGFPEPYIVTLHENTGEVLRIVARFKYDNIIWDKDDNIVHITPEQYFSDLHCLPNPDGGFWSLGFAQILYSSNEAVNSIFNMLIDSGTLNNNQGGIYSRHVRFPEGGQSTFGLNEWKAVTAPIMGRLQDHFMPLPTKEPSPVLFQLLGLLIESARDISSVTDVLQGKQPAQNVAVGTAAILEKQGLTLYTAMQKRLFGGLKKELGLLFELIKENTSSTKYQQIIGEKIDVIDVEGKLIPADFLDTELAVSPVFDPSAASDTQKMLKIQQVTSMLPPGIINWNVLGAGVTEILQVDMPGLIQPPSQEPSPEEKETSKKIEVMDSEIALNLMDYELKKVQLAEAEQRIQESKGRVLKSQADAQTKSRKVDMQGQNIQIDAQRDMKQQELETIDRLNRTSELMIKQEQNERGADNDEAKLRIERIKAMAPKPNKPGSKK